MGKSNLLCGLGMAVALLCLATGAAAEMLPEVPSEVLASTSALLARRPKDHSQSSDEVRELQSVGDNFEDETHNSVFESHAASWLVDQNVETEDAADNDEEKTIAVRLEELESKHADLQKAHDELEGSLNDYAKSGHSAATMSVNGRIHIDMWQFPGDSPGVNGFETGDNDDHARRPPGVSPHAIRSPRRHLAQHGISHRDGIFGRQRP